MTSTPNDYITELLVQLAGLNTVDAVAHLRAAAHLHPFDPRPHFLMAGELADAGDMVRAEAAYLAALHRAPDFAIARFQLGFLQFTEARIDEALATWAPLNSLEETHFLRLFASGLALLATDQIDQARALVQEGIARNGEIPPLNRDMALVLERLKQPLDDSTEASPSPQHFLVSNYGRDLQD